jgi:uncharacterized protein (TIGR00369 family)
MTMTDLNPALVEEAYPLQAHLGFVMTGWAQGYSRFELPLEPFLMNRYGIPHGGVHAMLLDTVMGFSGSYTGDPADKQMAMTLSMTVNYLGQAQGDRLIGEGRVTGGGRKTFFAEGKITDTTGTIIATATGVFRIRGR